MTSAHSKQRQQSKSLQSLPLRCQQEERWRESEECIHFLSPTPKPIPDDLLEALPSPSAAN